MNQIIFSYTFPLILNMQKWHFLFHYIHLFFWKFFEANLAGQNRQEEPLTHFFNVCFRMKVIGIIEWNI